MSKIKYLVSVALASVIAMLPVITQGYVGNPAPTPDYVIPLPAQYDAFLGRCVDNIANDDVAALLSDFRTTYSVPSYDDVSVYWSTDPNDRGPTPNVALGCVILVIVVTVVVWGVAIYITYKICVKPPPGGSTNSPPVTNTPPRIPPPILN